MILRVDNIIHCAPRERRRGACWSKACWVIDFKIFIIFILCWFPDLESHTTQPTWVIFLSPYNNCWFFYILRVLLQQVLFPNFQLDDSLQNQSLIAIYDYFLLIKLSSKLCYHCVYSYGGQTMSFSHQSSWLWNKRDNEIKYIHVCWFSLS